MDLELIREKFFQHWSQTNLFRLQSALIESVLMPFNLPSFRDFTRSLACWLLGRSAGWPASQAARVFTTNACR